MQLNIVFNGFGLTVAAYSCTKSCMVSCSFIESPENFLAQFPIAKFPEKFLCSKIVSIPPGGAKTGRAEHGQITSTGVRVWRFMSSGGLYMREVYILLEVWRLMSVRGLLLVFVERLRLVMNS